MDEIRKQIFDLLREALASPRTQAEMDDYNRRLDLALKGLNGLS